MISMNSDMLKSITNSTVLTIAAGIIVCGLSETVRSDEQKNPPAKNAEGIRYFETHIRPLLATHCYKCHGAKKQEGSLRLDTFDGIMNGGDSGASIVSGEPKQSLLIAAVGYKNDELQMPPDKKLADRDIAKLVHWIGLGTPHPDADGRGSATKRINLEEGRKFWAFQPPVIQPLPEVTDTAWPRTELDHFVLAKLDESGLNPAPPADRRTLIRRATFDLTGLPPRPEDVDVFLADESPNAFAKVIDRLLESPHYGERWGRHWLDVARYADSNGLDENIAHGNAWRYRDYVVNSFNHDKPFDEFVVEQLAGDLLPKSGNRSVDYQHLIATAFLALGPKVLAEVDETKMEMDIIDEQIDTLGRSLMGLTLGCSRCHDHKFDPIANEDYYALAGIFKSTRTMEHHTKIARWWENPIPTEQEQQLQESHRKKLETTKAMINVVLEMANQLVRRSLSPGEEPPKLFESRYSKSTKAQLKRLRAELAKLEKSIPEVSSTMGVTDREVTDIAVHLRGSHLTLGKVVPRRFPVVLAGEEQPTFDKKRSGRLKLARWLTSDSHPLTSRVFVNRVWRWHFGTGIVGSPDNFGNLGERPVNQPLLDWLAVTFRESGWSLKSLHRLIMLSSTYQMSSRFNKRAAAIDPMNRLQWRANIRRLEAESIRDATLAVSGLLDRKMGGSLLHVKNRAFFFDHTSKDTTDYKKPVRSLYLPIVRNNLYGVFQLFDYSDAGSVVGSRTTSTVAPQALFMMNSNFMQDASSALADCVLMANDNDEVTRIRRLYRLVFNRAPTETEVTQSVEFLRRAREVSAEDEASKSSSSGWPLLCQIVLSSNEFVYIR